MSKGTETMQVRVQRQNERMAQGMAAYIQRPVAAVQNTLQQMWDCIRRRDANYENRITVEEEVNNVHTNDDGDDDDNDDDAELETYLNEEENDVEDMAYNSDHKDDDNENSSEGVEGNNVMKDYMKVIRDRLQMPNMPFYARKEGDKKRQ